MPRTPLVVGVSVFCYRMLLAAYPAAFRDEYGVAMTQLFRDAAVDGYLRGRELGLLAVWWRTLVDFSVSVVREHRERATQAGGESRLLRDLVRQWGQLGSSTLSVLSSSVWYVLHLLHLFFRRSALAWGTFTVLALGIWIGSLIHGFTLWHGTPRIAVGRGVIWIRGLTEVGEPISEEQFQKELRAWRKVNQPAIDELQAEPRPWQFSFVSDIPGGVTLQFGPGGIPRIVKPSKSWELRFPSVIIPAFLLWGTIRAWRRRTSGAQPAMQSA